MVEIEQLQAVCAARRFCARHFTGRLAHRAALQAEFTAAVEHGDQPDDAGVAVPPLPGKALQGATLACQLVEIAAHILDRRDAGCEQRPMRRIPFRKIVDRLAAGRLAVFRDEIFDLRAVAVRTERGRQRMIDGRGVDADKLDALLHQPIRRALAQSGRMAEIFLAVGIFAMPAGRDQDDVAGLDVGLGAFEVGRLDQCPFALRDRDDDAGAEKPIQLELADTRRAGNEMQRRVDVRRSVKNRGDLVRHHALLGVVGDAFELDLLVAREDRRIRAPAMAELVEFEPAHGIDDGRHFTPSPDATDWRTSPPASALILLQFGRSVSRSNRARKERA